MSATARPIKYVPVDDLIGLRNQMIIERILPTVPKMKNIVPIQTLVIKCIFLAISMSNSSASGVDLAFPPTMFAVVESILKGKN